MNILNSFRRPQRSEPEQNEPINSALQEARRQFEAQDLPFPYIPEELAAGFKRLNEWVFGSGHHGIGLYNITEFATNARTKPQEDYLLIGHAGHGIQSYAMHYYVARNPLYLFLQIAYGGAYTDPDQAREAMIYRFDQAERIIKAVPGLVGSPTLPTEERWIITSTDFYRSSWIISDDYTFENGRHQELDESRDLLQQVLERLDNS